jgi:aspartate aminotransferase
MLARRVRAVSESATLALNARAKALKAKGAEVISFAAGELDFPPPEVVRRAVIEALDRGETRYTDVPGTPALRAAIAEKLECENGLFYDPRDIVVSCGAKHSIYNAVQVLCDEGDEVLIPSPHWLSYPEIARLAGAEPRFLACDPSTFKIDPRALERAITERTRILILNSPSNPTGAVLDRDDLAAVAEVVAHSPAITIISDEIYEKLVFGGARHDSIAAVAPALRERTIVVGGVSKTFAMTGFRIGWAAGPREVVSAMGRLQSHSTSNPTSIAQAAAAAALRAGSGFLDPWIEELDLRRRLMTERLKALRGFSIVPPRGAFYCFPSIEGLLGDTLGGRAVTSALDLTEICLEKAEVVLVPGEPFGSGKHVRLSFAMGRGEMERGLDRLEKLVGRR